MKKTVFSGLLAFLLVFFFIGCDNGTAGNNVTTEIEKSDLYGTWYRSETDFSFTIAEDEIKGFFTLVPDYYIAQITNWESIVNDGTMSIDYPNGFEITEKYTVLNGDWNHSDDTIIIAGDISERKFFLGKDKKSFTVDNVAVFIKQ